MLLCFRNHHAEFAIDRAILICLNYRSELYITGRRTDFKFCFKKDDFILRLQFLTKNKKLTASYLITNSFHFRNDWTKSILLNLCFEYFPYI